MSSRFRLVFLKIFVVNLLFVNSVAVLAQVKASNLSFVDPTIGGVGVILEPTRPLAHLPNSMLRMHPLKADHLDDQISDFPLTITSHRLGAVFGLLPLSGKASAEDWNRKLTILKEQSHPYYYTILSEDDGTKVEFTPQAKSGYFRVVYGNDEPHSLRLGLLHPTGEIEVSGKRILQGTEDFNGMKAYFYAEVNEDIVKVQYQNPADKKKLIATLDKHVKQLDIRYGISFIGIEQAKQNLNKEIPSWGFDLVKNKAQKSWDKVMDQIEVKGGTTAQKRVFYTALYRSYERMIDVNEYGNYYSASDGKVHPINGPFYVDNWIWDTYIALQPLNMILDPAKDQAMIRSYIEMYRQYGWIPSFAVTFGDWPAMVGNYAAVWMADSWNKGLRDFDLKTAYEGLRKNSLEATLLPWRNGKPTVLDSFYNKKGYMPALAPGERETVEGIDSVWERRQAVSVTLENSYSDWCIAQLAVPAGYAKDKALFLNRAENYKNVFRKDHGMVWPKDIKGNWIEPYNPKLAGREYFTENNAYTYNWHVKQDLQGLFNLMGGRAKAQAKLDELFRADLSLPKWKFWAIQPDASGLVGQFVMGNEPGMHIPYLYNYLGSPWKTQKRIRMLMDTWFTDGLFGMPGDEDGGGMSSYVVLSMMGFFQVTPGVPIYSIGSPSFETLAIKLPNGKTFKLIAKNNSKDNVYIQSAAMNGKPLNKPWFTHQQLVAGGTLELVMGPLPNKTWGAKEDDAIPSFIDLDTSEYSK